MKELVFRLMFFVQSNIVLPVLCPKTILASYSIKKLTLLLISVSTGGAAGLFLGASLISVVELIMYFCVRIIPRNHPSTNTRT
jgi:hypothetical protein